ncbi:MAG: hypothetical protein U0136_08870 [Bdellovibrionota bacterium]
MSAEQTKSLNWSGVVEGAALTSFIGTAVRVPAMLARNDVVLITSSLIALAFAAHLVYSVAFGRLLLSPFAGLLIQRGRTRLRDFFVGGCMLGICWSFLLGMVLNITSREWCGRNCADDQTLFPVLAMSICGGAIQLSVIWYRRV